jgi:hypothetical protein
MRRLLIFGVCIALCGVSVHLFATSTIQNKKHYYETTSHEERVERRAARLAEQKRIVDSLIVAHNFEFNPQTMQQMPAGQMFFLSNVNYTFTIWRGAMEICLPYIAGITPPYRRTLLNTGSNNMQNYKTVQTDNGWIVSFNAVLYAEIDYTFTLEVTDYGDATLTISNDWYNDVKYTGTISQVY